MALRNGYLTAGLGIALAVASLAAFGLWGLWTKASEDLARVEGEYSAFREGVRKVGEEQEAKNKETLAQRERINATALKTLQNRYSDLDARYGRLRKSAGINSNGGILPPVPDPTRPTDDSARDQRLLEILRHADQQTAQLIELQNWVSQQTK